jgi:HTH-type transcriptional regulator/antitoxin HigA
MKIKPIKTEADYEAALAEVERLWDAEEGTPAGDKLDILITLVEKWEDLHYPIAPPDPVEAILFYMEQKGLTRKDLEPYLGQRSRVADVLNRKRPLSLQMIRNLHDHLGIPADILLRQTPLAGKPKSKALPAPKARARRATLA